MPTRHQPKHAPARPRRRLRTILLLTLALAVVAGVVWAVFFRHTTPIDGQVETGEGARVVWHDDQEAEAVLLAGSGDCAGGLEGPASTVDRSLVVDMTGVAPGTVCRYAGRVQNVLVAPARLLGLDLDLEGIDDELTVTGRTSSMDGVVFDACGGTLGTGGSAGHLAHVELVLTVTDDVTQSDTLAIPADAGVVWTTVDDFDEEDCF